MGFLPGARGVGDDVYDLQALPTKKSTDSKITDQVLTVATNFELPVLGVHDSFIVAQGEQDMLTQIVETATREILGTEFPIEVSEPAFLPVRSQGYLARQERHRDKYG